MWILTLIRAGSPRSTRSGQVVTNLSLGQSDDGHPAEAPSIGRAMDAADNARAAACFSMGDPGSGGVRSRSDEDSVDIDEAEGTEQRTQKPIGSPA